MRNSLRKDKNFVSLIGWMKFEVSGDHHQVCDVGEILIADTSLRPLPYLHPPPPQFSSVQSQQLELTELLRKKKKNQLKKKRSTVFR